MPAIKNCDSYTNRVLASLVIVLGIVVGSLAYAVSHIEVFA